MKSAIWGAWRLASCCAGLVCTTQHTRRILLLFALVVNHNSQMNDAKPRKIFHANYWPHETDCDTKTPAPPEKNIVEIDSGTKSPAWYSLTQRKSNQWNNNSKSIAKSLSELKSETPKRIRKKLLPRFIDSGALRFINDKLLLFLQIVFMLSRLESYYASCSSHTRCLRAQCHALHFKTKFINVAVIKAINSPKHR